MAEPAASTSTTTTARIVWDTADKFLRNVVDEPENASAVADLALRLADWSVETEDATPVPLPVDHRSG